MSRTKYRLIVEDFDRNVETEVVGIINWTFFGDTVVIETKGFGTNDRTESVYNTRNFRTLTFEPMED